MRADVRKAIDDLSHDQFKDHGKISMLEYKLAGIADLLDIRFELSPDYCSGLYPKIIKNERCESCGGIKKCGTK